MRVRNRTSVRGSFKQSTKLLSQVLLQHLKHPIMLGMQRSYAADVTKFVHRKVVSQQHVYVCGLRVEGPACRDKALADPVNIK